MKDKDTKDLYQKCALCGKPTLKDLLDPDGICDYCKELRRTEGKSVLRLTKALKKRKWRG